MNLSNADQLARFYTKADVGGVLIDLMAGSNPRSLIDLGAGQGNLSRAALARWHDTHCVTVDIDGASADRLRSRLHRSGALAHIHHVHDVLDPDLHERLLSGQTFDASISNPPYLRPIWRPGFEKILDRAGFINCIGSPIDVSADILFMAQSIRMTAQGGTVGLILPDGVITGRQYRDLRKALLSQHAVSAVVQLPRHSFHGTEAQAFILVFNNGVRDAGKVPLQQLSPNGELSPRLTIDRDAAVHRMDFQYHAVRPSASHSTSLESLGASIKRGSISATVARRDGIKVFHTTDFSSVRDGYVAFNSDLSLMDERTICAAPGDIVLARIDRSFEKKIALVTSGSMPLSDCVYRIRLSHLQAKPVAEAMQSPDGRRLLVAASRGIGARLIGKAELLSIPFPLRIDTL